MQPLPEATSGAARELDDVLSRVQRRLRTVSVLRALTAGMLTAAVVAVSIASIEMTPIIPAASFILTAILVLRRRSWSAKDAAAAIETTHPDSRNLVLTAEELRRHPERATPRVVDRVLSQASAFSRSVDPAVTVPLQRDAAFSLAAVAVMTIAVLGIPQRAAVAVRDALAGPSSSENQQPAAEMRVVATIVPPAYLQIARRTIENPDRVDAIAGSKLEVTVSGAEPRRIRFGEKPLATSGTEDALHTALVLTESGYLAIDGPSGDASGRRLIAVSVTPDRAPSILISQPGKDLLVPDARPTIPISASANDDFGLRSLELRYTKVSGSGEQFEFEEGSLPLDLTKETSRAWEGKAALALARLDLQPGDSVVYRVVGRDARPGDDGLSSSDTFFVEVAGPGQVTLAGFELPPERERYALSQQMIVLKIQRLRAREQSLPRPALAEETAAIAAEQRSVRANFIFLTGGQIEDEVEEAEHSHEIQEGRLENAARREIAVAIQHMGRADQALIAVDTSSALAAARAAVEALQRAFGRNRYILRTLPVRSRIDPARRLTGDLERASDALREIPDATRDRAAVASRQLMSRLIEIRPLLATHGSVSDDLTSLAEEALSVDDGAEAWQRIAKEIVATKDLARAGRTAEAESKLAGALALIRTEAAKYALTVPPEDDTDRTLRSAWAAERHRR